MRTFFNTGTIYRHSSTYTTLDIKVLSIFHINDEYTKMKIQFIDKLTGDIQYTGKGIHGLTDTIKIKTVNFGDWTRK